MLNTSRIIAPIVCMITALSIAPAPASAQFGGLINKAKQAVRTGQPKSTDAAPENRNNVVPITGSSLDAYINGARAEHAEIKRLDSLESVSMATPELMRTAEVQRCTSIGATVANLNTPAQQHADSVRMAKLVAGIDTAKMKRLAQAAQAGDAAAMAELVSMSRGMAVQQMQDPATMARIQQVQKGMDDAMKRQAACEKKTPPASSFASRIASAKAEMARYGSRSSAQYTAHLSSVKYAAAGGMSPAQYAALEERIRGYAYSNTEPEHGFSQEELALLRAHRAELKALSN